MEFSAVLKNLPYMLDGLRLTLLLAAVGMAGSLIGGTVLALMRLSRSRWLRWPAAVYVDTVRMVPLIMVIFWVFFLMPIVTGRSVTPVTAALVALAAFNSSYMAEVIRAALQSVPKGFAEAARSSGLSYAQCHVLVIFPIALRNMLPALVSRFIALFMGTSLAYVIGVTEFFRAANNINNRVFKSFEIYLFVAIVYFVCCYSLSLLARWLQARLDRGIAGPPAQQQASRSRRATSSPRTAEVELGRT